MLKADGNLFWFLAWGASPFGIIPALVDNYCDHHLMGVSFRVHLIDCFILLIGLPIDF